MICSYRGAFKNVCLVKVFLYNYQNVLQIPSQSTGLAQCLYSALAADPLGANGALEVPTAHCLTRYANAKAWHCFVHANNRHRMAF